mmetsp:Transcript_19938/g.48543  ORF Transcript_19938/g.48543 Transcript_19938/m.48543 type:complete len:268 (-) Transcript_19938:450-1253(-)
MRMLVTGEATIGGIAFPAVRTRFATFAAAVSPAWRYIGAWEAMVFWAVLAWAPAAPASVTLVSAVSWLPTPAAAWACAWVAGPPGATVVVVVSPGRSGRGVLLGGIATRLVTFPGAPICPEPTATAAPAATLAASFASSYQRWGTKAGLRWRSLAWSAIAEWPSAAFAGSPGQRALATTREAQSTTCGLSRSRVLLVCLCNSSLQSGSGVGTAAPDPGGFVGIAGGTGRLYGVYGEASRPLPPVMPREALRSGTHSAPTACSVRCMG